MDHVITVAEMMQPGLNSLADAIFPAEILDKIAEYLCTCVRVPRCYCTDGLFLNDSACKCDRPLYTGVIGVRTLNAFAMTCRRMLRHRVPANDYLLFRRRSMYLRGIVDVRIAYLAANNLTTRRIAELAAESRNLRASEDRVRLPAAVAVAEIRQQYKRSRTDAEYARRHDPDMSGARSVRYKPSFCKCGAAPRVTYFEVNCGVCGSIISVDALDRVISCEW